MAVCCQNLPLGALSTLSAPSVLVGALFKKFGLFLNTPRISPSASENEKSFKQALYIKSKHTCFVQKPFFKKSCHLQDNVEKFG